jgi:hypothetical protein
VRPEGEEDFQTVLFSLGFGGVELCSFPTLCLDLVTPVGRATVVRAAGVDSRLGEL